MNLHGFKLGDRLTFLNQWRQSSWQSLQLGTPLLLLGLFFEGFNVSFLQPDSFFYQIFDLRKWNWLIEFSKAADALSQICFSSFLLLLCVATAVFQIQQVKLVSNHSAQMQSSLAAVLLLLTISYSQRIFSSGAGFNWLGGQATFLEAMLVGLLGAGTYYGLQCWFTRQSWMLQLWQVMLVSLIEGSLIRELNHFIQHGQWFITGSLSQLNLSATQLPGVVTASGQSIINTLQLWVGAVSPGNLAADFSDDAVNSVNLAAALTKNSLKALPEPLNLHSLLGSYALLGGTSQLLALLLVLLLIGNRRQQKLAKLNLVPVFFNLNGGLFAGIPLFFNWELLVPLILAPLVSIWLAAGALALKLLPPAVYPTPNGTPALLNAFLGTDGKWQVLAFTIVILLLSMLIYYPFVSSRFNRQTSKEVASFV
ncbi:hypothetical protein [Liquorilactobacillus sicerae]|uniref:hypothetical protein n=1 Tax=Liquorilactobacillus sicerae TaxID=1416943 RepID=UPI00248159BE|nr:hypothetical protein [Liquorilactobacillus sicerae]